ncbi:hypothetical protein [Streptomyces sp. NK08204]|uniref:hypothetical protein n=1 Tax=Streptomyces sp. NK08204 TaxID=2873260 RepID=UPI001CED054D|nr:hypothetical protein [Streptomyces sp. NK08204]
MISWETLSGLLMNWSANTSRQGDRKIFAFCGAYEGLSGLDSVGVDFSLAQELPEKGEAASIFTKYIMGKTALASTKVAVLYFNCSSGKFDGATVLIRGEVRSRYDVTEPPAAAREDNLRILHDSSQTLSALLKCKAGTGPEKSAGRCVRP